MLLKENQEIPPRLRASCSNALSEIVMIETQQESHDDAPASRQMADVAIEPQSLLFHQSHLNDDDSCSSFSSSSYYEMEEPETDGGENAPWSETNRYEFVLPISFSSERRRRAPRSPTHHQASIMDDDDDDDCMFDFDECEDSVLLARRLRGNTNPENCHPRFYERSDEDSLHLTSKRGVRRIQRKVSNEGRSEEEVHGRFYTSIDFEHDCFFQVDTEIELPAI